MDGYWQIKVLVKSIQRLARVRSKGAGACSFGHLHRVTDNILLTAACSHCGVLVKGYVGLEADLLAKQ
jgi:hypothetical protein